VQAQGALELECRSLRRIFFKGGIGVTVTGAQLPQDMRSAGRLATRWAAVALGVLPAAAVACGQPLGPGAGTGDLVKIRALTDVSPVGPGQTFHLVIVFNIEPKWHIYWKNPGEGAMPPRVIVEAPRGFEVAPPRWPRPTAVESPIGPEYCYFDEVALFVPIKTPPRLTDGRVTLRARVDWAVCRNVCRLGSGECSVVVQTTARATPAPPTEVTDPAVRKHRKRLPRALDQVDGGAISWDGTVLTVSGPTGGRTSAAFFPDHSPGVTYDEPKIDVRADRFVVRVSVDLDPDNALGEPMVVGGLVALGRNLDDPCYDFQLPANVPSSR
jgi:thiol:disulfide interchange protein DsbD